MDHIRTGSRKEVCVRCVPGGRTPTFGVETSTCRRQIGNRDQSCTRTRGQVLQVLLGDASGAYDTHRDLRTLWQHWTRFPGVGFPSPSARQPSKALTHRAAGRSISVPGHCRRRHDAFVTGSARALTSLFCRPCHCSGRVSRLGTAGDDRRRLRSLLCKVTCRCSPVDVSVASRAQDVRRSVNMDRGPTAKLTASRRPSDSGVWMAVSSIVPLLATAALSDLAGRAWAQSCSGSRAAREAQPHRVRRRIGLGGRGHSPDERQHPSPGRHQGGRPGGPRPCSSDRRCTCTSLRDSWPPWPSSSSASSVASTSTLGWSSPCRSRTRSRPRRPSAPRRRASHLSEQVRAGCVKPLLHPAHRVVVTELSQRHRDVFLRS